MKKKEIEQITIPVILSSNKIINLNEISESDINLKDIANSLSKQCRYNGHVSKFYSVAEHCVRLARYAYYNYTNENNYNIRLASSLILHDAAEAYIGDMIHHLKSQCNDFKNFESKIEKLVASTFKISQDEDVQEETKSLDKRISFDEMYIFFDGVIDDRFYNEKVRPLGINKLLLDENDSFGWTPDVAKERFLALCQFLGVGV